MSKLLTIFLFCGCFYGLSAQQLVLRSWYPNGHIQKEYRIAGDNSQVKWYTNNGELVEVQHYTADQPARQWSRFNAAGELTQTATFKNGKRHGVWQVFCDEGFLKYRIQYQQGRMVNAWEYDDSGAVVAER